jgi:hypothetical protein
VVVRLLETWVAVMSGPGFPLPDSFFDRLFNLHTGTEHEFYCDTCGIVTKHYSTTHSAQMDSVLLKFLARLVADFSGLGNLIEGKPYVCKVCRTMWFE